MNLIHKNQKRSNPKWTTSSRGRK